MCKVDISYWGYSVSLLKMLIDSIYYNVTCVITQNGKYTDRFAEICLEANIPMISVNSREELIETCKTIYFSYVLVYCFGIIIPEELYREKIIVNIHPGSLETNRGAHSILWSILIPDLGAEIAAYKICCNEIDSGELIASVREVCDDDDNPIELVTKLEKNLPYIMGKIYEYFTEGNVKGPFIKGGVYRKRVTPEYYTLDIENDTKSIIKRKINSQSIYDGAILIERGERLRITGYVDKGAELILIADDGSRKMIMFENERIEKMDVKRDKISENIQTASRVESVGGG